jgi:type I restriction enzyme M protein
LLAKDGDELETHYRHVLEKLGTRGGMLGLVFKKAQNKIQDPAKLRRLVVDLIDKENWSSLGADVKGDAYEGLLEKNAADVKGGAGQYFTPRALIRAMVEVVAPRPGETVCDPACGTGGFLLAAHDFVARSPGLDKAQKKRLKSGTLYGIELVDGVTRLCAMNLILHGITSDADGELPIVTRDALASSMASTTSCSPTRPSARRAASRSSTRPASRRRSRWSSTATTSGPRRATSSSTSCSTSSRSSNSTAVPRSWCPTTCCSRAARARRSDARC